MASLLPADKNAANARRRLGVWRLDASEGGPCVVPAGAAALRTGVGADGGALLGAAVGTSLLGTGATVALTKPGSVAGALVGAVVGALLGSAWRGAGEGARGAEDCGALDTSSARGPRPSPRPVAKLPAGARAVSWVLGSGADVATGDGLGSGASPGSGDVFGSGDMPM